MFSHIFSSYAEYGSEPDDGLKYNNEYQKNKKSSFVNNRND